MSLLELVENSKENTQQINIDSQDKVDIYELKKDVEEVISADRLANLLIENPIKAKNELESVCKEVFLKEKYHIFSKQHLDGMVKDLEDVIFGMGPIQALLNDKTVSEIMINGASEIYVERAGRIEKCNLHFSSDEQVRVLIDKIVSPLGRRVDESSPMVNARLPQGHRVNAILPPIALCGPVVTIRAFSDHVISFDEMVESGSIDIEVKNALAEMVQSRKNIVVSGGTGSGKTTLLNAMSQAITKGERIITIEDAAELKFEKGLHVVALEARPKNAEGTGEVTIRDLVKNALRMRPDRIIVGECRGGEALDMLQAMNTGHDGSLTTLHANSPQDVIERIITLVRYAIDLPTDAITSQIGSAFDYIVQVARDRSGSRFVSNISQVEFNRKTFDVEVKDIYTRESSLNQGRWLHELC